MEEKERDGEEEGDSRIAASRIWSWGAGTDGQLCTGKLQDGHHPQHLVHLSFCATPISQMACGGAHVIALTKHEGKVLAWGRGTSGQLGHGDLQNCLYPKLVESLESLVISHVGAGWNHSGFVSDSGKVFTCGDGSFGQLGHGDFQLQSSPLEVLFFRSKHVAQIACGMRHSLVLVKGQLGGTIYGFGSGKRGQLGVSKDKIRSLFNLPQLTLRMEGVEATSIIANGDHSAALTVDGHLYTWGRGFNGASDANLPQPLPSPLKFTQAALGWNHALVLTEDGEVFMLGGNHHGMLTDPQKSTLEQSSSIQSSPCQGSACETRGQILERVPCLGAIKAVQIAVGAEHSALVTENGEVMTWGWGEHGQLGLGNTCDQTGPKMVMLGHRLENVCKHYSVYCGSGFTFAVG